MPTNVRLLLRGLLVLDAKEGRPTGKVGIPQAPPPPADPNLRHALAIRVTRVPVGPLPPIATLTRPNIRPTLSLEITGGLHRTIDFRDRNPVDRHQPATHPESVRWFVDLESPELYGRPIGTNGAFESVLTFNGGQVFCHDRPNESILMVKRPGAADFTPFGRVALALGVDFLSATRAVLKNGNVTVFDSQQEAGTNYRIEIIHEAPQHPPVVEDANHYYTVIGTTIPPNQRILFRSITPVQLLRERLNAARLKRDTGQVKLLEAEMSILPRVLDGPAGPEAACFTTSLGDTDI